MEKQQKVQELKELIRQISDDTPIYKIQEMINAFYTIIGK